MFLAVATSCTFAPVGNLPASLFAAAAFPLQPLASPVDVMAAIAEQVLPSALDAPVWDTAQYVAGSLARPEFCPMWDLVTEDHPRADTIKRWLSEGVRPSEFWCKFKGSFGGVDYQCRFPPPRTFRNHKSATSDELVGPPSASPRLTARQFVDASIAKNLQSGAIIRWADHPGSAESPTPHLVLPLGVEPEKPRLIWDGRYLNLWQRKVPFTMERATLCPHLVIDGAFMWTLDHHSGFHHVPINIDEQTFFGFAGPDGTLYVSTVMNFGWRHAPYIYNTLTHAALSFLRLLNLRLLYYTDDIWGTSHRGNDRHDAVTLWRAANLSAFLSVLLFTALGYFLSPKSRLCPTRLCTFLGLDVDSIFHRFSIPPLKLDKFLALLLEIMAARCIRFRQLERVAGKAMSFALALPGAMFFVRGLFRDLARLRVSGRNTLTLTADTDCYSDLAAWLDIRTWHDESVSTWPTGHHTTILLFSDASSGTFGRGRFTNGVALGVEPRWGGTLHRGNDMPVLEAAGYFPLRHRDAHINVLEAIARFYVLEAFASFLYGARVVSGIDNLTARRYFVRDGGRDPVSNEYALRTFRLQRRLGCHLADVDYVPSKENPADAPSRTIDTGDHRLNPRLFQLLNNHPSFGCSWPFIGFTADWMASGRNAQRYPNTDHPLPFFSRFFEPGSAGCDFFAQLLNTACGVPQNGYINPPWVLIPAVISYLREAEARGTIIVPEMHPAPAWWPLVMDPSFAKAMLCIAQAGDLDVFLQPSRDYLSSVGPCPFAVWAVAFDFS